MVLPHPDDNLVLTATLSLDAGVIDPAYPLLNLINGALGIPAKFLSKNLGLVIALSSPAAIRLVILQHTNIRSNRTVRIQANNSASWGAPPFLSTTTIVTTDANGLGYRPDPHGDPNPGANYSHYRLSLDGDNAEDLVISGLWMSAVRRQVTHNPSWGVSTPEGAVVDIQKTDAGVKHALSDGATTGGVRNGHVSTTFDVGLATYKSCGEACRWRSIPIPIIFDPSVNRADYVRWAQDEIDPAFQSVNNVTFPVAFDAESRGEAWP